MSSKKVDYLSTEEIDILRQLFDFLDKEGKGEINPSDLINELKEFGFDKENPTIFEMIALMGSSRSIKFDAFMESINSRFFKADEKESKKKIFNMYAKAGHISLETLQQLSKEIGDNISNEEWKEIYKECIEGSNQLGFDVFCELMVEKIEY